MREWTLEKKKTAGARAAAGDGEDEVPNRNFNSDTSCSLGAYRTPSSDDALLPLPSSGSCGGDIDVPTLSLSQNVETDGQHISSPSSSKRAGDFGLPLYIPVRNGIKDCVPHRCHRRSLSSPPSCTGGYTKTTNIVTSRQENIKNSIRDWSLAKVKTIGMQTATGDGEDEIPNRNFNSDTSCSLSTYRTLSSNDALSLPFSDGSGGGNFDATTSALSKNGETDGEQISSRTSSKCAGGCSFPTPTKNCDQPGGEPPAPLTFGIVFDYSHCNRALKTYSCTCIRCVECNYNIHTFNEP